MQSANASMQAVASAQAGAAISANSKNKPKKILWGIATWLIAVHVLGIAGSIFYFSWGAFATFLIFYVITGMLGITLGYHRLLSHRSFKTHRWIERTLATFGSLAMQGSPIKWVATHRQHHSFSDTEKDPHNSGRGFFFSHVGWLFADDSAYINPNLEKKFARDICNDPYMRWLSTTAVQVLMPIVLGLVLLFAFGPAYLFWGFFLRIVLVYHVTWSVNSFTHKFGYKNFDNGDKSLNNWLVALFAFGEGWHNNHHTFQEMARNGLKWWEVDVTFYTIKVMSWLKLAWSIKTPPMRTRLGKNVLV